MRLFIIISIYILIPFLTSFAYKKLQLKRLIIATHIVVLALVFIYPYLIFEVDDYINPPDPEHPGCGMPIVGFFIANIIIMIPITQGLLILCNYFFKNLYFPGKSK